MTKGNDCIMQHVQSNLGIPSSDMWLCYCYTEMCNYPFTWKEFVSRGYPSNRPMPLDSRRSELGMC
ncbi:Protein CBG14445 [Caenorhabditis briggsae]|uniref:Protein CBG14445 n=1 Tax=Caenorhabditis briggsae TaxID=6238 RepID=A8XJZ3_CAEBR|nr:Protein CBG14445 [Caenorhabditis briggsae]CAP32969.2 Protein CBG14445 [Caenorhabditis briggsae]